MKAFAVFVAGFAGIALLMALCDDSLVAQEAKKDEVKKDETKKDETKTDETKMDDKKVGEKKKVVLADPQLVIKAKKQVGKIKGKTDDPAEITVILVHEARESDYKEWYKKEFAGILKAKPQDRVAAKKKFDASETAERDKIFAGDELQVSINDAVRIRSNEIPKAYDDAGKEKKLTAEQKSAMKQSPLPGYKASVSNLRIGQIVELYIKPLAPVAKAVAPTTKKGPIGADLKDAAVLGPAKIDVYLIQIKQEPQ